MTRFATLSAALCMHLLVQVVPAEAARLRPVVELAGRTVHLSDLFADLEPGQDCAIGDGPPPGGRLSIGQPQLQAIADEFGVAWAPGPGWQSVTLDHPGDTLDWTRVEPLLRRALVGLGLPERSSIKVPGWQGMVVERRSAVSIASPTYDPVSGRVEADLLIEAGQAETTRLHLRGTALALSSIVVPSRTISAGQPIEASDLDIVALPASQTSSGDVTEPKDLIGLVAARPLLKGRPIDRAAVRKPFLVDRGALVTVRLAAAGIRLTALGEAVDTGAAGDRVRVFNYGSSALLVGVVVGPDDVEVDPGETPASISNPASLGLPSSPRAGGSAALRMATVSE